MAMDSEEEETSSMSPWSSSLLSAAASSQPLLLNPAYARSKSVIHDELRSFRVFLQWCALDHSSRAARAASYAAFLALALAVPAAVSLSLRADAGASPVSASAITFNRVAQAPATGLAAISFAALASFFRRGGGLRQLLFLDGGLRDDTAFVRRGYARELDRAFRLLAALLLPSLCVEAAHKAVFFFATVRVEPPLPLPGVGVPWRAVALVATVASWVYRTGVFLLVCVLFRLTCELQILRFEGIYHMFDVEARAAAAEIFAEHRRIRTQLLATSHRYRAFILSCLVTITVSQLGALVVALSSKDGKSFANSGDLLVTPHSHSAAAAGVAITTRCLYPRRLAGRLVGAAQRLLHVPLRRGEDHAQSAKDRVHREPVAHEHGGRGAPRQVGAIAGGAQLVGQRRGRGAPTGARDDDDGGVRLQKQTRPR